MENIKNIILKNMNNEKTLKNIMLIAENIHVPLYDDLNDYLKGIRDMINLIYNFEDNVSIKEYVLYELNKLYKNENLPYKVHEQLKNYNYNDFGF